MKLHQRMASYKELTDFRLMPRLPVIIHISGKKFKQLSSRYRQQDSPWSNDILDVMISTTLSLVDYSGGSVVAYIFSDQIILVLKNDQTTRTQPFLNNKVTDLSSVFASRTTALFIDNFIKATKIDSLIQRTPTFKVHPFVVPNNTEVINYLKYCQLECRKIFVTTLLEYQLVQQDRVPSQELYKITTEDRTTMLDKMGIDINAHQPAFKNGVVIRREEVIRSVFDLLQKREGVTTIIDDPGKTVTRLEWQPDLNTPLFNESAYLQETLL